MKHRVKNNLKSIMKIYQIIINFKRCLFINNKINIKILFIMKKIFRIEKIFNITKLTN
jgi:hypothetical protein